MQTQANYIVSWELRKRGSLKHFHHLHLLCSQITCLCYHSLDILHKICASLRRGVKVGCSVVGSRYKVLLGLVGWSVRPLCIMFALTYRLEVRSAPLVQGCCYDLMPFPCKDTHFPRGLQKLPPFKMGKQDIFRADICLFSLVFSLDLNM